MMLGAVENSMDFVGALYGLALKMNFVVTAFIVGRSNPANCWICYSCGSSGSLVRSTNMWLGRIFHTRPAPGKLFWGTGMNNQAVCASVN